MRKHQFFTRRFLKEILLKQQSCLLFSVQPARTDRCLHETLNTHRFMNPEFDYLETER